MAIESADDLAAMFSTTDDGRAATFTPAAGAPAPCTILLDQPQDEIGLGPRGMRDENLQILVRASELAADPAGGQFSAIASFAGTFKVRQAALDSQGAIWTCHVARTI